MEFLSMIPRRRAPARGAVLAAALSALAVAGAPAAAQAAPTAAEQTLIDRAAAYLAGLTTAKGRFIQTDARGATTQGALYLQRPGKARFAYDAPSGLTVVADGKTVSVADARLKTFDSYPLRSTPLALFLRKDIRLGHEATVTEVDTLGGGFSITATDAAKATRGRITLNFADAPVRLIGWTVTDARGSATRVRLTEFAPASGLDQDLFMPVDPRVKRKAQP